MEERRLRVASLFEWIAAAACAIGLLWIVSVPLQRMLGPRVEAAIPEQGSITLPPGVPAGAASASVFLLMDGREIRTGDLRARLDEVLPPRLADGPPNISQGQFGDRETHAYVVNGARVFVVCERAESSGPMRVTGIYVP